MLRVFFILWIFVLPPFNVQSISRCEMSFCEYFSSSLVGRSFPCLATVSVSMLAFFFWQFSRFGYAPTILFFTCSLRHSSLFGASKNARDRTEMLLNNFIFSLLRLSCGRNSLKEKRRKKKRQNENRQSFL